MATPPSAKRRRITGGFVTINVGPAPVETLTVHESLLRDRGGFFEAALKKQWREGKERKINLPDDKPDVVAAYIEWIYSGKIEPVSTAPPTPVSRKETHEAHLLLARLYVFGEKITDDKLCNDTISAWTKFLRRENETGGHVAPPSTRELEIIYEGTPVGSPVRRFMVYLYSKGRRSWFKPGHPYDYSHAQEFLLELVRELLPQTSTPKGDLTLLADTWFKPTIESSLS